MMVAELHVARSKQLHQCAEYLEWLRLFNNASDNVTWRMFIRHHGMRMNGGTCGLGVGQYVCIREAIRAIMTDLTGGTRTHHMDTSKESVHSDDSQETTFSSTSDKPNVVSEQDASVDAETEAETLPAALRPTDKRRYPYWQLFFIMAATTGERY